MNLTRGDCFPLSPSLFPSPSSSFEVPSVAVSVAFCGSSSYFSKFGRKALGERGSGAVLARGREKPVEFEELEEFERFECFE